MKLWYGSLAILPTTCCLCNKTFWLEGYRDLNCTAWNITSRTQGVNMANRLYGIACKECAEKNKGG